MLNLKPTTHQIDGIILWNINIERLQRPLPFGGRVQRRFGPGGPVHGAEKSVDSGRRVGERLWQKKIQDFSKVLYYCRG